MTQPNKPADLTPVLAPADAKTGLAKVVAKEPVLVSSVVAAIGVFSTIRWGATREDLVTQLIGGLLPVVLGFIIRQFVEPLAKQLPGATVDDLRANVVSLAQQLDGIAKGNIKTALDALVQVISSSEIRSVVPDAAPAAPPVAAQLTRLEPQMETPPPVEPVMAPTLEQMAQQPNLLPQNPPGW